MDTGPKTGLNENNPNTQHLEPRRVRGFFAPDARIRLHLAFADVLLHYQQHNHAGCCVVGSKTADRYDAFARAYAESLNATDAALKAGYSPKTAYSQGQRLLKNVEIQSRLQRIRDEAQKRTEVSLDRVIEEMARVAFSDLRKTLGPGGVLLDPSDWDDDTAAAIASLEVVSQPAGKDAEGNTIIERVHKIKTWDKMSALEKLGRHLGLGDKKKDEQAEALNNILSEISRRGSAAPIATAHLYRDEDKDEG